MDVGLPKAHVALGAPLILDRLNPDISVSVRREGSRDHLRN